MLQKKILEIAKTKPVLVLFDMDGTLVEFGVNEKEQILENAPGFYFNKRPIKTMLKIAEGLSKKKNITVGIMSNCYYFNQKEDKLRWLKDNAPFIEDKNIYINVYNNRNIDKLERSSAKLNRILNEKLTDNNVVYLIEDTHEIIKTINKELPDCAHHLSELIK